MEKQTVAHSGFSLVWRKRNQLLAGYLVRRVEIVIPILKNCLVICERLKSRILCFELNAVEKYNVLEKVFKAVRDESYFHLVAVLFEKKKRKKLRKDTRTKIGNFVYIAADMHTRWKKVKRTCL